MRIHFLNTYMCSDDTAKTLLPGKFNSCDISRLLRWLAVLKSGCIQPCQKMCPIL